MTIETITVEGNGPIGFMDSNGNQVSVPLSALEITSGQVGLKSDWENKPSADDAPILKGLLAQLQREGYLRPAPPPAQKPAMILRAANPGPEGKNIKITVSDVTPGTGAAQLDPLQTTFSVTATETDVYPDLTLANIATVLGTDQEPNKGTGLVHVVQGSVASDGVPAEIDPQNALELGSGEQKEVKDKDDNTKTLFKLEPRGSLGSGDPKVKVTITNVDAGTKTFTLTAIWGGEKVDQVKIDPATLESKFQDLAYLVKVSPPASGAYSVPDAKTEQGQSLSGGNAGSSASLTLFSKQ